MKKGKREGEKEERGMERKEKGREIAILMGGMHRVKVRSRIVIFERTFG